MASRNEAACSLISILQSSIKTYEVRIARPTEDISILQSSIKTAVQAQRTRGAAVISILQSSIKTTSTSFGSTSITDFNSTKFD